MLQRMLCGPFQIQATLLCCQLFCRVVLWDDFPQVFNVRPVKFFLDLQEKTTKRRREKEKKKKKGRSYTRPSLRSEK